jgi:DNA polymerase
MTTDTASTLVADYAATLDWWREAGVDLDYSDEPTAWLREPETIADADPLPPPRTAPRVSTQPALDRALAREPGAAIGGDLARWPTDLAAFHDFWLTEPSLDPGSLADRVAPVGEAGAELLLLVGQPDEGDREALLSGEQGALVIRILRAMGIDESRVYLASALPRPTPMPDWDDLASRGLAALTCHHLRLAAPRRVITFGKGPSMLAADSGLPTLAAPQLETLARSAAHKRRFWNQWLEWSAPSAD